MWTVKTVPHHKNRRWYSLHWNGESPISFLKDGRTMGLYKNKPDAMKRAEAMNRVDAK